MLKHITSLWNRHNRNNINSAIDVLNQLGVRVQNLVAEGQLTPSQYATLIKSINGLVKKGEVSINDINKNLGKIDQTYLTDELLQQMAGDTPVNAVPADGSLTTHKFADKSVTFDKTSFASQVAVLAKNIIDNSGFTKDSDGDGLADGWWLAANGSNPRISNGRQYWYSDSAFSDSGALRGDEQYDFIRGHVYYIRFEHKNVLRVRFNQLIETSKANQVDGIYSTLFSPESSGQSRISLQTYDTGESWVSRLLIVDLTDAFGAGNEPTESYFSYLLNEFTSSDWFPDTLNLIDANENGIITAKELKVYDPTGTINGDNVNDALIGLEEKTDNALMVKGGRNLYNSIDNITGNTVSTGIGSPIAVNDDENYVNQRLRVDNTNDISLRGIRSYVFVDSGNLAVSERNLIDVNAITTISSSEIPEAAYFLWVATYPSNAETNAQIGIGTSLSVYEPYEAAESIEFKGEKLFDMPIKEGDVQSLHEVAQAKLENDRLYEEVKFLKSNSQALFNVKMDKPSDSEEILLKKNTAQKLILHLHNRENDGFDTDNDVYSPNAESDFSDIKITNDKGEPLKYRIIHHNNNLDVIADSRLGGREKLENSQGVLISLDSGSYISESNDGGVTWQRNDDLLDFHDSNINLITHDDTFIFNHDGFLYRSEPPYNNYEQVFELPTGYSLMQVRPKGMVQHPDGEIFFATYQNEHALFFFKSIDDGRTWESSFEDLDSDYQHTHAMYVDVHSNPVAVYAGVDRGGGIYKTTDKGETWIDLREGNDFPQSTDFGVRYADPSGYRLVSGETAIVGGYSLLKTTDDINFRPVLEAGASIHYIYKMDGRLFACGAGTRVNRQGVIFMSEDEGENWVSIYNTAPMNKSDGANDGFREMTQLDDQLLVGEQGGTAPLRIFPDGNYAEIVVDVPENSNSIIIESGYAYSNTAPIVNNTEAIGDYLVKFDFNEGGRVIQEKVSGQYFNGDFKWDSDGKHLSYFYPFITSPSQRKSMLIKSLNGLTLDSSDFDVSDGMTISFWGKISENTLIDIFRTDKNYVLEFYDGYRLRRNLPFYQFIANVNSAMQPERLRKIDWTISSEGTLTEYINGQLIGVISERAEGSHLEILSEMQNSSEINLLKTKGYSDTDSLQHFSIRKGVINSSQLMAEYNSHVEDNIN